MHVHLPKPLHGWRAFVGEVGIIVVGVLIALAAEQLVDEWQWRQKVGHAEAAMRLELSEDDGPEAYGRALIGPCLDQQIMRIHDGAGRVPVAQLRQWAGDYAPPFRTWDSEAWKVVVASDTGSHMGPDRLVAWSAPYRILPMLNDQAQREGQLVIDLRETLPPEGDPSPSDLQSLRRTAAQLRLLNRRFQSSAQLLLTRIASNGAQVRPSIQRALLVDARALYGSCVAVPDLNSPPSAMRLIANLKGGSLAR
jgi:hypothetical protein